MARKLTVGEVARTTGTTVRTLHHYDQIGLLSPSERSGAGYRVYTSSDMARLHSILLYRELGFSLDAIEILLESSAFDRRMSLSAQRDLLFERIDETERIIEVLDREIERLTKGDEIMSVENDPYAGEAKERWGDTAAYKESMRRTKTYTKNDWAAIKEEGDKIESRLAELLRRGCSPAASESMDAVDAHRQHISRWFYPCSHKMQLGLGQMYVADPRFTAHYDDREPGLAHFVFEAIKASARRAGAG